MSGVLELPMHDRVCATSIAVLIADERDGVQQPLRARTSTVMCDNTLNLESLARK